MAHTCYATGGKRHISHIGDASSAILISADRLSNYTLAVSVTCHSNATVIWMCEVAHCNYLLSVMCIINSFQHSPVWNGRGWLSLHTLRIKLLPVWGLERALTLKKEHIESMHVLFLWSTAWISNSSLRHQQTVSSSLVSIPIMESYAPQYVVSVQKHLWMFPFQLQTEVGFTWVEYSIFKDFDIIDNEILEQSRMGPRRDVSVVSMVLWKMFGST